MGKVYLSNNDGAPQYACTACSSCRSALGISLCNIQNRGCCSYFPKFELHDIHEMSKTAEGLQILDNIRKMPGTNIYNFYIHAKGYFDENGYKNFLNNGQLSEFDIEDKTVFFRTCPFVKPGKGCSLPVRYRHYICNVFICKEVVDMAEKPELFQEYIEARHTYAKWIKRENESLEMLLREKDITLAENFDEVIAFLKDISVDNYEFPQLPDIVIDDGFSIGA